MCCDGESVGLQPSASHAFIKGESLLCVRRGVWYKERVKRAQEENARFHAVPFRCAAASLYGTLYVHIMHSLTPASMDDQAV